LDLYLQTFTIAVENDFSLTNIRRTALYGAPFAICEDGY